MKRTITKDESFLAISVDEAKAWCRIDNEDDDDLVEGLIKAATDAAEAFTGRCIVPATITYELCGRSLLVPTAPIQSVTSVVVLEYDGTTTVLTPGDDYWVKLSDSGATVVLTSSRSAPLAVTVNVGHASAAAVPQAVKQALAVHIGSSYEGREGQDTAAVTFQNLLMPWRLF